MGDRQFHHDPEVWRGQPLRRLCWMVGLGRQADLVRELNCDRKTVVKLWNGEHQDEPVLLLEQLHRVIDSRCRRLGVTLTVDDVRQSWRVSDDQVTGD